MCSSDLIERNLPVRSGTGFTDSWTEVDTVFANVEAASGGEALAQGVQRSTRFHRVTIRFLSGLLPTDRIIWDGDPDPMHIRTVSDRDGDRRWHLITTEAGTAN